MLHDFVLFKAFYKGIFQSLFFSYKDDEIEKIKGNLHGVAQISKLQGLLEFLPNEIAISSQKK